MTPKILSPKTHAILDYALVGGLLTVPTLLGLPRKAKILYALEGLTLLGYIATTKTPAAAEPLIPFKTHEKIDPLNLGQFAFQTFLKPIRGNKKAMLFNIGFTLLSGAVVALTDWNGRTKPKRTKG